MVSRPRITAMSNQPATFEVRERIPYLTKTVTQEGGVPTTEFELVFDEAGIQLDMTAFVSEGGVITMEVRPSAGFAHRLHRRRLQCHGPLSSVPR
jgi:type II secretory pathway component GspD/PulD (secretin)